MKKILMIAMFLLAMLIHNGSGLAKEETGYEKYGKIAILVVETDYPSTKVTDYKYEGRKALRNGVVEDRFLFIVNENGKKLQVVVRVRHSLVNTKMLNLTVEEKH